MLIAYCLKDLRIIVNWRQNFSVYAICKLILSVKFIGVINIWAIFNRLILNKKKLYV